MEGLDPGIFGYDVNSGYQDRVDQEESALEEDCVQLSDKIFLFPSKNIGGHDNIYEGEMRSAVYGVRQCVIKFATLCEQNVREAEILTKLGSHTNVIAIIQSGTYCDVFEERVYIALDKCHNENLRQYLANRKRAGIEFDLNQAIDFAKQIIVGVMYIHDNNAIHLDLKPSNILISQNLQLIKIADFGLSIIVMSPKSKVFHKRQFGTNGYRPIESFDNGEVSMRTDIFSLGTVLLHLLSNGNDVFGCDEHTFIHNVMNDVTDTSGLLVSNPHVTEHLIKCMINKERCRRPTIWEVSDHPCWTGKEVDCEYEYFADDEIDDDVTDARAEALQEATSPTDIERDIAFVQRMREMGFNRKPTIVVFDNSSRHLYRIDDQNKSMTKMQEFPFNTSSRRRYHQVGICVIAIGEYIYIFQRDRSVYRLEYCDVVGTWERMPDWIENESGRDRNERDLFDCLVPSVSSIFLLRVTTRPRLPDKGSVFEYNTSSSQWDRLPDKLKITWKSAIVRTKGYLYCIGGYDEKDKVTNNVERLNFETKEWKKLPKMKQKRMNPSADECNKKIYVLGRPLATGYFSSNTYTEEKLSMEMYNPEENQWTELKSANDGLPYLRGIRFSFKVFSIEDNLYAVVRYGIIKYDVKKNTWTTVMSYNENMQITRSVLVKMSS